MDKMDETNQKVEAYCEKNRISGMLRVTVRDEIIYEAFYRRDGRKRTHIEPDQGYI